MNEVLWVYSVTISATRDELDPSSVIPDADWSEAWQRYAEMQTAAVLSVFPEAEVEVLQQASARGLQVNEANGYNYQAAVELGDVVAAAYEKWTMGI